MQDWADPLVLVYFEDYRMLYYLDIVRVTEK